MHDDLDQIRIGNQKDIINGILDIARGKRIVFPVIDKGPIVGLADTRRPLEQFLLILEPLDLQLAALQNALGYPFDTLRNAEGLGRQITGHEIHFLLETHCFHQPGIVFIVVVHHGHHLAMLEALDLDTIAVERRQAFRTDHRIQAATAGPLEGCIEERPGNFQIVDGVESIEMRLLGLVIFIERPIVGCADAAHHFSIAHRDKEIRLRMLKKRMLLAIERQVSIHK